MSTTEGRAGYYRLVASGHGAALAAAFEHVLASIAAAEPEAVASHGVAITDACSQLIGVADLLSVPEAGGALTIPAAREAYEQSVTEGEPLSVRALAAKHQISRRQAGYIRAEVCGRTGEDLATGQLAPPMLGLQIPSATRRGERQARDARPREATSGEQVPQ